MDINKTNIGIYKTNTERMIYEFCASRFENMGYRIVRIRFRTIKSKVRPKGKGARKANFKGSKVRSILQIMIDNQNGNPINIADCEKVSKYLSFLDEDFPVDVDYSLEVSSAGIERPLTRVEDFKSFSKRRVKVATVAPILEGQKVYRGHLISANSDSITLKLSQGGEDIEILYGNIHEANLDFTKEELDALL